MSDGWRCPEDRFPIGPSTAYGKPKLTVPIALVLEHERQAQANHGQSVSRLKERGGLSWCELSAVLDDRKWVSMDGDAAHERAMRKVLVWQDRKRREAAALGNAASPGSACGGAPDARDTGPGTNTNKAPQP